MSDETSAFSLNTNIIIDTREQYPWDMSFYGFKTTSRKLDYGDYSIEGHEDKIAIERKAAVCEIVTNLGREKDRFHREMKKLQQCKEKYIICEFPQYQLLEYPEGQGMPKRLKDKAIRGYELIYELSFIEEKFGVKTIFCENRFDAELLVSELLYAYIRQL